MREQKMIPCCHGVAVEPANRCRCADPDYDDDGQCDRCYGYAPCATCGGWGTVRRCESCAEYGRTTPATVQTTMRLVEDCLVDRGLLLDLCTDCAAEMAHYDHLEATCIDCGSRIPASSWTEPGLPPCLVCAEVA